jgi:hypothetical protein
MWDVLTDAPPIATTTAKFEASWLWLVAEPGNNDYYDIVSQVDINYASTKLREYDNEIFHTIFPTTQKHTIRIRPLTRKLP